jgi:glyoxylase-like metal-dependent hydrolase (beta-lactamase superfamily II)
VRIHTLTTGRVRQTRRPSGVRRYVVSDWSDVTLPVNAFLIEHPLGLCLVDAGQTAAAAEPGYFPRWYPFFRLSRFELERADEAAEQLRGLGFDARDVRWVVLTHMHTDHVGGIAAFRGAEVVVSETEWSRATGLRGKLNGYLPQYWPAGIEPAVVSLDGPGVGPFVSSHDLTGDGSLVLVSLPGHTPGHIGVLVRDGDRAALIAGDAAHTASELAVEEPQVVEYCRAGTILLLAHDDDAPPVIELSPAPAAVTAGRS